MAALRQALFGWPGRGILTPMLAQAIGNRLNVILAQVERLAARLAAGLAVTRAPRAGAGAGAGAGRPAAGAGASRAAAEPVRIWPREFGWLLKLMSHRAAVHHNHLEYVLREPEWVALLEASPQARRLLRPVCRMLGMPASVLRPGSSAAVLPRARAPRPSEARVPAEAEASRATRPNEPALVKRPVEPALMKRPAEPARIKLPRGVITWVRENRRRYGPGG